MSYFSAQIILIVGNSDGEDVIWGQMLVLAVLATLLGVGGIIKARADQFKRRQAGQGDYAGKKRTHGGGAEGPLKKLKGRLGDALSRTAPVKTVVEHMSYSDIIGTAKATKTAGEPRKEKDLTSGIELLEQQFLVSVVEQPQGDNKTDLEMRKLSFNELSRRQQLKAADSKAIKIYAINKNNRYGKDIQRKAIAELARRTRVSSG